MTATQSVVAHLSEDFLAQVYQRTYRLMPLAVPGPGELLTFNDLNTILATHRLEPPRLRLAMGGEALPLHRYSRPQVTRRNTVWHRLQPAELHTCLAEGATLVLDAIDEIHPEIGELAGSMERVLHTGVQVNAYASWTATEGFGVHWDDHDTLVIQISGAKRWRIYGPTRLHPTFRDVALPAEPTDEPSDEFVINAGDMLYVPRGHWHSVSASEGVASLHLTCGLQTMTGADLIGFLVDELRNRESVRADLPQFAASRVQRLYLHQLADEVACLLDDDGLLERFFTHRDVTDHGRNAISLPYVSNVPDDPELAVRLTTPRARLDSLGNSVRLRAGNEEWQFDLAAQPVLSALIGGQARPLSELAALSGLEISAIAELASELVDHQVAAISEES